MNSLNEQGTIGLSDLLYINKMKKNKEEKRLNGVVSITNVHVYEVCFPLNGLYHSIRYVLSAHIPAGEDILDLITMEELKEEAEKAIKSGKVKTLNEFWEAYKLCLQQPELIRYRALTQEETRNLYGQG
jgi:hypothetical protein